MSLQLQWREWATPLMRYGVRFIDIGLMGRAQRQKYRAASKLESLASAPALCERRHRGLARRLIAVPWMRALLPFSDCPHPGPILQSNGHQKDAADDDAAFENLVVLLIPADGCAFEDQRGHGLIRPTTWPAGPAAVLLDYVRRPAGFIGHCNVRSSLTLTTALRPSKKWRAHR